MSSRPEAGILVPIADINEAFIGSKVRSVGFLESYEARSACGSILNGGAHLAVDFSLVSDSLKLSSLTGLPKIMVIGTIGTDDGEQDGCSIILQAIHVALVEALDIHLWERAAREQSRALHHRASATTKF